MVHVVVLLLLLAVAVLAPIASCRVEPFSPAPRKQELYVVGPDQFSLEDARAKCAEQGSRLASYAETAAAVKAGARWPGPAWMADGRTASAAPLGAATVETFPPTLRYAAACYGVRPPPPPQFEDRKRAQNILLQEQAIRKAAETAARTMVSFAGGSNDVVYPFDEDRLLWSSPTN